MPPRKRVVPAPSLTEEEVAAYNKVVSVARLQTILLTQSAFETKPGILKIDLRKASPAHPEKMQHSDQPGAFSFDPEKGVAISERIWQLTAGDDAEEQLRLTATFVVFYSHLEGCDEDAVRRFVVKVGRFAIFPYFRNLVSQFSWLSQSDLPVLPVLRGEPPTTPTPRRAKRKPKAETITS